MLKFSVFGWLWRVLAWPMALAFGGGDSSSSSSTSTSTTQIDKRQVVGDAAVGVSSDQSTVNVTVTDRDAVGGALDFAGKSYQDLLALTRDTFEHAFAVVDKSNALAREMNAGVEEAYKVAQSSTSKAYEVAQSTTSGARDQQKVLLIVAAGAVAYAYVRGKFK